VSCLGNNPETPYGTPLLPPPPGEPEQPDELVQWGRAEPGLSRTPRLAADEVVLVFGTAPPEALYFSYRGYLASRGPRKVIGSLGPSANQQVLEAQQGGPMWGRSIALITSNDPGQEARVVEALLAAGWSQDQLVLDRIPEDVFRFGWDEGADTWLGVMRVALYQDPAAGAAYQLDPPLRVLRLTPVASATTARHPWPTLPERGSGQTEEALRPALTALQDALTLRYADRPAVVVPTVPYWNETLACLFTDPSCTGDLRDRFVAVSPGFRLRPGEAAVVFGVNHQHTGKATYASASVQTLEHQVGIRSLTSLDMPGTAASWLPGEPAAADLYAWTLTRDCAGWPAPCFEVPDTCGPDEELKVTIRAYLEPATGAAPLPEEMLGDRVLLLGAAP
jgi:hypothetical protein